jgi:hypothetical protein
LWAGAFVVLVVAGLFGFIFYGTRVQTRGLPSKWLKELEGADSTMSDKTVEGPRGETLFSIREWDEHSERRVIFVNDLVFYTGRGTGYVAHRARESSKNLSVEMLQNAVFTPRMLNAARDELRGATQPFSPYQVTGDSQMSYQEGDEMRRITRSDQGFVFSRLRRGEENIWLKASEVVISLNPNIEDPGVGDRPAAPADRDLNKTLTWAMQNGMLFVEFPSDRGMSIWTDDPRYFAIEMRYDLGRSLVLLAPRHDAPKPKWPITLNLSVKRIEGMLYDRATVDSVKNLTFAKPSPFTPNGFTLISPGDLAVYRLEAVRRVYTALDRLKMLRRPGHPSRDPGTNVATRTIEDLQASASDLEYALSIQREWGAPLPDPGFIYWQLYLVYGEMGEPFKARDILKEGAKAAPGESAASLEIVQAMEREGLR